MYRKIGLYLLVGLLLAACGAGRAQPTPVPRATSTPFSTALPIVATALPLGGVDTPLRLALAPADLEAAQALEVAQEAELLALSGVSMDLILLPDSQAVLAELCGGAGQVSGLLGGLPGVVVYSRDCAQPFVQLAVEGQANRQSAIVLRSDARREENTLAWLAELEDWTYCRLGLRDETSWLIPSLLLQAANLQPSLLDLADEAALRQGLADGTCDAAGLPRATLSEEEAAQIAAEAPPLPVLIWWMGRAVPLEVRRALQDVLLPVRQVTPTPTPRSRRAQAEATEQAEATQAAELVEQADSVQSAEASAALWSTLLGQPVSFEPLDPTAYEAWEALASSAGLDWATLGE